MAEGGEDTFEALARETGPGGDRDPRSFEHVIGLVPGQEVAELVGTDQEHRIGPLGMRPQRVDRARVCVEKDLVGRERGPGQTKPYVGRRIDVLVAGVGDDEHNEPVEPELGLRAPCQLHVSAVRRVEGAAEDPDHEP